MLKVFARVAQVSPRCRTNFEHLIHNADRDTTSADGVASATHFSRLLMHLFSRACATLDPVVADSELPRSQPERGCEHRQVPRNRRAVRQCFWPTQRSDRSHFSPLSLAAERDFPSLRNWRSGTDCSRDFQLRDGIAAVVLDAVSK